jgi:hypothetical protein
MNAYIAYIGAHNRAKLPVCISNTLQDELLEFNKEEGTETFKNVRREITL